MFEHPDHFKVYFTSYFSQRGPVRNLLPLLLSRCAAFHTSVPKNVNKVNTGCNMIAATFRMSEIFCFENCEKDSMDCTAVELIRGRQMVKEAQMSSHVPGVSLSPAHSSNLSPCSTLKEQKRKCNPLWLGSLGIITSLLAP